MAVEGSRIWCVVAGADVSMEVSFNSGGITVQRTLDSFLMTLVVMIGTDLGGLSLGREWSGEEISLDWDWLMTVLVRSGRSSNFAIVGGVSKFEFGLLVVGVSGRPLMGNERMGNGVRERRGGWEFGERAAKRASRVLMADAWILCFLDVERVVLMVSGQECWRE